MGHLIKGLTSCSLVKDRAISLTMQSPRPMRASMITTLNDPESQNVHILCDSYDPYRPLSYWNDTFTDSQVKWGIGTKNWQWLDVSQVNTTIEITYFHNSVINPTKVNIPLLQSKLCTFVWAAWFNLTLFICFRIQQSLKKHIWFRYALGNRTAEEGW